MGYPCLESWAGSPCHVKMLTRLLFAILVCCVTAPAFCAERAATYGDVHAIFAKHCLACHDSKEAEGSLVLETPETIYAGGDSGDVIVPGNAAKSLQVKRIEHGEKPFMPPPKKAPKLADAEIAAIRAWIDAGAPRPKAC